MVTTQTPAEAAEELLARGQTAAAIETIRAAAQAGDPQAVFQAAVWHLVGSPLPRDLARARSLLRRAVEIGDADAALLEIGLTANGSGAAPDWSRAHKLLAQAAASHPIAAEHLALVDAMRLDDDGNPTSLPRSERLGAAPDVERFPALLSPAECEHIAMTAQDLLQPAVVVDPRSGKMVTHPVRTSFGAVIGPARESLVIRAINKRIAAISQTAVEQGEPLAVLRYTPGQEYRPHLDSIAGAANQRIKTVLIYLNQGFQGGETLFTANGLKVSARGGDAIVFSNVLDDGRADHRSEHAGLAVLNGVKWLATRWVRERAHDPWVQK